jgi:paraquat-inducible protein B
MALDPDILFFDEPSAGLDPIRSRRLDELILAVRDSLGATVVVTHELSRRMGDALRFPLLPPVWRKIVGVVVFSRGQFLSEKRLFVLFLEGSVKGLNIGAPVDFQGVQIGSVTDIRLHYIAEDHEFRTPVFIELEPARITEVGVRDAAVDAEIKEHGLCKTSIDRGLRAQLATQSLVIGQLFVQMVFHPDTPVRLVGGESKVLELPTIPTTLQQASQEAQELLKKLGELPLDQLFANVLGITQGLNRLVNAPETQALVHVLSRTTTDVQELVRHLQGGPQLAGGHPAVW